MCQAARHVSVGAHPTSFLLYHHHLAPPEWRPHAVPARRINCPFSGLLLSTHAQRGPFCHRCSRAIGAWVRWSETAQSSMSSSTRPTSAWCSQRAGWPSAIAAVIERSPTLVRWRERCSRLLVAAVRTAALLGWTGLLLVPCIGCHALGRRAPALVVRAWHSGCCTIVRLRVRVCGAPSATGPTLSVANHVSYLDIVVLGSLVNAGFIAKVEVATWPLLGWIARIGRTVFIERRGLRSIGQRDEIAKRASRLTRA
jgi:Acyltransferase